MRSSCNPNQRQGHPNTYKPECTNSGFVYEVPHVYSWGMQVQMLLVASYSNTSTLSVSGMRKRPYHCVMQVSALGGKHGHEVLLRGPGSGEGRL